MSSIRIGCQSITWGEDQNKRFPEVFAQIANVGYQGVELGFRRVRNTPPSELKGMLKDNNLVLLGLHIGGNLENPAQADSEKRIIDEVLEYLSNCDTELLMFSGLEYNDDEQFNEDLDRLNRIAELCHKSGVNLLYHNHHWEFHNGEYTITELLKRMNEYMGLCPDIGWFFKGGKEPIGFLEEYRERIKNVHFKDFATKIPKTDTVCLGDGVVPLAETAEFIKKNMTDIWVVAEQDFTDMAPEKAAKRNAEFLEKCFS